MNVSGKLCELQNLQDDLPASWDLPREEQEVNGVESDVKASCGLIPFLHGWNEGCSKCPEYGDSCDHQRKVEFLFA